MSLNFAWNKMSIIFFLIILFVAIYFKYTYSRKWPNFDHTVLTRVTRKSQSLTYVFLD